MAVQNGAYADNFWKAAVATAGYDKWTTAGANGMFVILADTCGDSLKFASSTATDVLYGASGTTNGLTEHASANGYTTGGETCATPAFSTQAGAQVKFTCGAMAAWTGTGAGITVPSPNGGAVFFSNNATAANKYLWLSLPFTGGPYTASGGGTFTVTANASGLLVLTLT